MMFADPIFAAYVLVMAGLLGLVVGSFVNCWAWRSMHGESVVSGRSHCTTCGHELGVRDLIPIVSWLAAGRKCRYCGDPVSARYPITEAVCALSFVGIVAVYGLSLETVELLAFAGILLFLSLTDLDDCFIPDGCIVAAIAVRAAYWALALALGMVDFDAIVYFLASGFGIGVALVVIVNVADKVFGRDSMGGGDLKLYFVAGLYFGWQQCMFLIIISCLFGIVVAIVTHRGATQADGAPPEADEQDGPASESVPSPAGQEEDNGTTGAHEPDSLMKRTFPFGPSIAAACVVTMLAGEPFVSWYLGLLL